MANFINNTCDFLKNIYYFIKKYLYDVISEKLYIKSIFVVEKIPSFALSSQKILTQMNDEEKKDIMKGLELISAYNQDFSDLRAKYILSSKEALNFDKFKQFLRTEKSGFYLKKAWLNFVFKVFLVLLQLLILFYNYPKHFCVNESIEDNDQMFWIYNNNKYKVKMIVGDRLFYLRIVSFLLDLFIIIIEFYVLFLLRRIKTMLINILVFQLSRFSIYAIIIYYEYSEKICEKTFEENKFFKKERKFNFLEIMNFIYDIYKILFIK